MGKPGEAEGKRAVTRRRALAWGSAVVGSGLVGVGGYALMEARERGYILRAPSGPATPLADHRVQVDPFLPAMVIARGTDPARNTRAALERIGGMARYVARDDVVVVKPNIGFSLGPYYAVTTEPAVVTEVVRACRDAGAREVIVSDGPVKNVDEAFDLSGIRPAALAAGASVVTPAQADYVNSVLPGWGEWQVLDVYRRATKIINVPIVKHHSLAGTTIGMKGWFGAIGGLRFRLHDRIDEAIVGLAEMMRPTLTVVDATRVLMRNGPFGGNLDDVANVGAVAVSTDPVAADAWGSSLVPNVPNAKLGWLELAEARGLGSVDFRRLGAVEIAT